MNRCPCRTVYRRTGCIDRSPVWRRRCFAVAIADHTVADRVEDESLMAAGRKGSDGVGVTVAFRSLADAACSRSRFLKGIKVIYYTVITRGFITKIHINRLLNIYLVKDIEYSISRLLEAIVFEYYSILICSITIKHAVSLVLVYFQDVWF